MGSSLGGNVIANILSDYDDGRIKAAALVTPALDMKEICENVKKTLFGFYNKRFYQGFVLYMEDGISVNLMRAEYDKRTAPGEFDKIWKGSTTVYEIEEAFNTVYYNRTDHVQL